MSLSSNLGSPTPFSAHSDLLDADIPTTLASKKSYIEEIKRRGKACVLSKNYVAADALYARGLEVVGTLIPDGQSIGVDDDASSGVAEYNPQQEMAVLYSNRSLVRLSMHKIHEALEDATLAAQHDPSYVKAHWRHGQACIALGNSREALVSYEKALELEPKNKALLREAKITKEKVELEEKLLLEKKSMTEESKEDAASAAVDPAYDPAADAMEDDNSMNDAEMQDVSNAATKTTNEVSNTKATAKLPKNQKQPKLDTESSATSDSASIFTKSDHVRGYKIRSDGKKTSYFDREISEDAKKLIGDIAPKKLDVTASSSTMEANGTMNAVVVEGTSAWNTAGTWEERDVTPWAKETLSNALLAVEYILPPSSPSPGSHAVVSKVSKLDGHASFATVRGKKRYIYEFDLTIKWVLTMGDDHSLTCHGEMTFPDIDGTVELGEGYDIVNYSVEGSSPAGTGPLLDRFIRDGGLRDSVHKAIDDWVMLFRNTY